MDSREKYKPDEFAYDPRFPVPHGRPRFVRPRTSFHGVMDQRPGKAQDVLVYTQTREARTGVTGPIKVVAIRFHVRPRHRFHAKTHRRAPNGEARNLTDGILACVSARLDKAELAQRVKLFVDDDAGVTSKRLPAGP